MAQVDIHTLYIINPFQKYVLFYQLKLSLLAKG